MPIDFYSYLQRNLPKSLEQATRRDSSLLPWIFSVSVTSLISLATVNRLRLLLLDVLNNLPSKLLNLTLVQLPKRKLYTLKDVSAHCTEMDCWMVIRDLVYDLTDFLREVCSPITSIGLSSLTLSLPLLLQHPAGSDIMLEYAGTDATMAFADKPHSLDAWLMLKKYLVGELVPEERMFDDSYSS